MKAELERRLSTYVDNSKPLVCEDFVQRYFGVDAQNITFYVTSKPRRVKRERVFYFKPVKYHIRWSESPNNFDVLSDSNGVCIYFASKRLYSNFKFTQKPRKLWVNVEARDAHYES